MRIVCVGMIPLLIIVLFGHQKCFEPASTTNSEFIPALISARSADKLIEPKERSFSRDRKAFARLLGSIARDMTKVQVLQILGKPDDIRKDDDAEVKSDPNCKEIWCFGTTGHLRFPTLGCVYFDVRNQVQFVFGGEGNPPPPSLFTEKELENLLSMMDRGPNFNLISGSDPMWAIRLVNTLQPLGKVRALAAIEEFDRVAPFWPKFSTDLIYVLRILFDVPGDRGYMPPVWSEITSEIAPVPPRDHRRIPRFPVLIVGDIPLDLMLELSLRGAPPSLAKNISAYRMRASLRANPLRPTTEPFQIYSEFRKSYRWLYASDAEFRRGTELIKKQLLLVLGTVYRGDLETVPLTRAVRWDSERSIYTFTDGRILPGSSRLHLDQR